MTTEFVQKRDFDYLSMNDSNINQIKDMLLKDGLDIEDVDVIIYGSYTEYRDQDLYCENALFKNEEYTAIFNALADGYNINEIKNVKPEKINEFLNILKENNITIGQAIALNKYCVGSNMILGAKRGVKKEKIRSTIINDLIMSLKTHYTSIGDTSDLLINYVKELGDFDKPLYVLYDQVKEYAYDLGLEYCPVPVRSAIMHLYDLSRLDMTIQNLDEVLSRPLNESLILWRAIKSDNLDKYKLINDLVKTSEDGYSSTSPIYGTSFAKYPEYEIVFEYYVPYGTEGMSVSPFSLYGGEEEELLLNSCDIYMYSSQMIRDENDLIKQVVKALVLSKNRSCYKGISKTHVEPFRPTTHR